MAMSDDSGMRWNHSPETQPFKRPALPRGRGCKSRLTNYLDAMRPPIAAGGFHDQTPKMLDFTSGEQVT